jgi:Uri superfamily endonuclease
LTDTPSPEAAPGTYLLLELDRRRRLEVGRLGRIDFPAGWYLYVGSAFGPGGVMARCAHHRRVSPRPRWHIDYLRAAGALREIWYTHDPRRREHAWAGLLAAEKGAAWQPEGFGASDCDCSSHLFYHSKRPCFQAFRRAALRYLVDQEVIFCEMIRAGQD